MAALGNNGSPASSVCSEDLERLLLGLGLGPGSPPVDLSSPVAVRREGTGDWTVLRGAEERAVSPHGATPPQPPGPAGGQQAEVIDLLDSSSSSSSSGSDSEGIWSVRAPGSVHRRKFVVDSDSDSDDAAGALPPYFAAIPQLGGGGDGSAAVAGAPRPQQPPAPAIRQVAPAPRRPPARQKTPVRGPNSFKARREGLARELYAAYNAAVFGGRLPGDLQIQWNNRLATTAGLTHYKRESDAAAAAGPRYTARVEMSAKVVDDLPKLERTLCHELCHVAAWLLDHTAKPPHGPVFRAWAERAMRAYPALDITTCHQYEIFFAFRWQCTNAECLQTYGRHSNSIDVAKKVCGACKCKLAFLGRFNADSTPAKQRQVSAFGAFVKENFSAVKQGVPAGAAHGDVMKKLSELWKGDGGGGGSENLRPRLDF